MDIMLYAIPVFFLLIGIELLVARWQHQQLYRFGDAISNISCGIVSQVGGVFLKALTLGLYILLYNIIRNTGLPAVPDTWWSYILLFISVDCLYYWFHRYSHEISAFWGAHVVHHQSEDYNLSVALRQSTFQGLISGLFYLPLAVIGFNPITFVIINTFQTLYQFWIHTETINKMPAWFEYVFNTPSHHRVHHGRNPQYIDKNHGGTLIIFDRMFGTFEPEREPVVYGVTKQLASYNPIWANFDFFKDLGKEMRPMRFWDKIVALWQKPGWRPQVLGGYQAPPPITRQEQHKYDVSVSNSANWYILFQYIFALLGTVGFLMAAGKAPFSLEGATLATLVFVSVASLGAISERKTWAKWVEPLRLVAIPAAIFLLFGISTALLLTVFSVYAAAALLGIVWFFSLRG